MRAFETFVFYRHIDRNSKIGCCFSREWFCRNLIVLYLFQGDIIHSRWLQITLLGMRKLRSAILNGRVQSIDTDWFVLESSSNLKNKAIEVSKICLAIEFPPEGNVKFLAKHFRCSTSSLRSMYSLDSVIKVVLCLKILILSSTFLLASTNSWRLVSVAGSFRQCKRIFLLKAFFMALFNHLDCLRQKSVLLLAGKMTKYFDKCHETFGGFH